MQLKRGNKADLQFIVKDTDGNIVSNLATATDIVFVLKINKTDIDDDAVIYKNLADGITIDIPSVGNVIVSMSSVDMNIDARNYFMALKIIYSATNSQEVSIKNLNVQDINYLDSVAVVENIVHA